MTRYDINSGFTAITDDGGWSEGNVDVVLVISLVYESCNPTNQLGQEQRGNVSARL